MIKLKNERKISIQVVGILEEINSDSIEILDIKEEKKEKFNLSEILEQYDLIDKEIKITISQTKKDEEDIAE